MDQVKEKNTKDILIGFLEPILGKYRFTAHDNIAFKCPFGSPHHKCQQPGKFKLEINTTTNENGENQWHCWVCEAKGKTIRSLLKSLNVPQDHINYIQSYIKKDNRSNKGIIKNKHIVTLPKEFIPLWEKNNSFEYKRAKNYCIKRGLSKYDIIKYGIGYCETGMYANTIIFPNLDANGNVNYFLSRSYIPGRRSFNAPECDKDEIIGFEFFINWNVPVIICEGPFDGAAIKRNAIPLFGKLLSTALKTRLLKPDVKTIYLALDSEVLNLTYKYAQELLNMGKEVYVVELPKKDPSDVGFIEFTKLLHKAKPLTFSQILLTKLEM